MSATTWRTIACVLFAGVLLWLLLRQARGFWLYVGASAAASAWCATTDSALLSALLWPAAAWLYWLALRALAR